MENTPQEILAVIMEIEDRLEGTWQAEPEDEELQDRFWSLVDKSEWHGVIRGHIGAEYLRENRNLLK